MVSPGRTGGVNPGSVNRPVRNAASVSLFPVPVVVNDTPASRVGATLVIVAVFCPTDGGGAPGNSSRTLTLTVYAALSAYVWLPVTVPADWFRLPSDVVPSPHSITAAWVSVGSGSVNVADTDTLDRKSTRLNSSHL